jgi:hypothetical protein
MQRREDGRFIPHREAAQHGGAGAQFLATRLGQFRLLEQIRFHFASWKMIPPV